MGKKRLTFAQDRRAKFALNRGMVLKVRLVLGCTALGLLAAACNNAPATTAAPAPTVTAHTSATNGASTTSSSGLDSLIGAAQAEGALTTIALPHELCNYGEMISTFSDQYGISISELAAGAGSAEQLEAIRTSQGSAPTEAPDVVDIAFTFGPSAKDEGLIVPYQVETWESIPDSVKDPDGYWYGAYYGVLAFEVNADVVENVPQTWADLLKPEYEGQIALAGDPRVSAQAISSVVAAGMASGGSLDDAQPGLEFFAHLAEQGNLNPAIATSETVSSGETPITIRWTYNALANRDASSSVADIRVVVPADSDSYAGVFVQAISAYAPHPNAAKLWMEFLYSDQGQNTWLEGYCYPIRYDDLVARGTIGGDQLESLPATPGAAFPTVDQIVSATELITTNWDLVVGVDVGG